MLRPALAAIGLLTVHASQAEPLHVPSQYPTIQAAIDASQTDDEIHIAPGVYRELLNPENKSVTLIGAGAGETILSGDLDGDTVADGVILDYQNEGSDVLPFVTFEGLTCESATAGLRAYRLARLSVDGCQFIRCDYGINMPYSQTAESYAFDVDLRNTNFQGPGGGVLITNTLTLTLDGCHFDAMNRRAIVAITDELSITNSSFTRGRDAGSDIQTGIGTILNCLFENNTGSPASSFGTGALALSASGAFELLDTDFINNGDRYSEAALIIAGDDEPIVIKNCNFDGNRGSFDSAVHASGVLRFEDCNFIRNVGKNVGPINFNASSITPSLVSNCLFLRNGELQPDNTYWPVGGGGLCLESGRLLIRDTVFQENVATTAGAVMILGLGSVCDIQRTLFYGNRAGGDEWSRAGAIHAGDTRSSKKMNVSSSVFIGNTAESGRGGAIVTSRFSWVSNCVFLGNRAKDGTVAFRESLNPLELPRYNQGFHSCIVIPYDNDPIYTSFFESLELGSESNFITTNLPSIRFTRPPSDGGDGFGDDPRTPDIDESLNDDFGDLRLLPGSPAIDAGGNAKLPRDVYDLDRDGDTTELLVGTTDLAGNPRFVDDPDAPNLYDNAGQAGPIDLGPYEFQPALFVAPPCAADTNNDGVLTPADFTAWIAAFNAGARECDQNADELCTPADFTAWIANFNAGC